MVEYPVLNDPIASRLRRAEVSLGLGPLSVNDRLQLSGEIILRAVLEARGQ